MSSQPPHKRTTEASEQVAATTYYIDGFRSLREFSLPLTAGLNVLVGPNGSGKTNFLDFLGFLEVLVSSGATNAVSAAGGVPRVFSQESNTRSLAKLYAKIQGTADLRTSMGSQIDMPLFDYDYEFELRYSKGESQLYISHEAVRFRKRHSEDEFLPVGAAGTLQLSRRSGAEDGKIKWGVGARLYTDNPRNPLSVTEEGFASTVENRLKQRLSTPALMPDQSILSVGGRYYLPALDAIKTSMTQGRSFNIIPEKAREPDDVSRPPGINRDGSGLTATLHSLQQLARSPRPRRSIRIRRANRLTLPEVIEWTKLVFPRLADIIVSQDAHTGKFLASLVLEGDPGLRIPFQATSDGTLKWLCLVCLILTGGGVYSLEEPENFLHPKMQEYLVQLIRESISDDDPNQYFLFSTHSETLINFCRPDELVIFDFVGNCTVARRVRDSQRIKAEINKTGFGLGYYYVRNALPKSGRLC